MASGSVLRIIVVKFIHLEALENKKLVLDIKRATSLMVTHLSRLQGVLGSSASLGVQMLPQIGIWRFDLFCILVPMIIFILIN